MRLLVLAATLLVSQTSGRFLRARQTQHVLVAQNSTPAEIKEKWDKMDEFLKIMFTISCKWKHGKDVNGAAAEKLQNGEIDHTEVEEYKKELRDNNLQGLTEACGKITAVGKERCRLGCGERWGEAMENRNECDGKCVTVYANFETDCKAKADNLQKVYEMKSSAADARKTCHEGFCKNHPTVWMKDAADMEVERDAQCATVCTEERITMACQRKWQLLVDFKMSAIASKCFEEGQVKTCYEGKATTAGTDQETCSSDGKSACATQSDSCKTDGDADNTFDEAKEFCEERKKLCESQVVEKCLKEHKAALETAQKECEDGDSEAMKECQADELTTAETTHMTDCTAETTPTCTSDCEKSCKVEELSTCLDNLKSEHDPATDFCEDFWNLLHDSAEVDPVTGDPIVLLAN